MGERASYDSEVYMPIERDAGSMQVLDHEFSERFADMMRNRMLVSFYKYGKVGVNCPGKIDALASMAKRIDKYRETGNAEWLVDVANFAMIEFMHPAHEGSHFRGTDSDESPGRVKADGSTEVLAIPAAYSYRRNGD